MPIVIGKGKLGLKNEMSQFPQKHIICSLICYNQYTAHTPTTMNSTRKASVLENNRCVQHAT